MVDRIVPATTEADRAAVERFGYRDAWPVVAEPFSQWVIEDRFAAGRPRWEDAGATMVQDVRPFELMKLRALNGAHSSLAYLGAVAGLETVADAMAEPALARFLRDLWDQDLLPSIPSVPGMDLAAYTAQLEDRFRNPAMRHRLQQIAMDGSQKLPQRLLLPALERLRQGHMPSRIALTVAAWMRFLLRRDERGTQLRDQRSAGGAADRSCARARARMPRRWRRRCSACGRSSIRRWPGIPGFAGLVVRHLDSLLAHGVRRTLTA